MTQRKRQRWHALIAGLVGLSLLLGIRVTVQLAAETNSRASAAYFQTITLTPEALPAGTVGVAYTVTLSASGGEAPYSYIIDGTAPAELTLDSTTGVLSGTVTGAGTLTFTVIATDANGVTGSRQYQISFTESGAVDADSTLVPTAEFISEDELFATEIALRRLALGPPRALVDPEIGGLAIRSGPFVGATLENIARPNAEYAIVGAYDPPGSRFTWYLIEYTVQIGAPPNSITVTRNGWISGRFVTTRGFIFDIFTVGNPFDGISTTDTGVSVTSRFKSNIYLYPAGNAPLIARFDEGSSMQVLGRTLIDQRDITYWIYVRLDRTGEVGWTRITPYFEVEGSLSAVPTY